MNLTWRFLADLLERAVKSFFQGYLVTAGVVHAVTPGDGVLPAADQLFTVNNLLGGLAMAFMSIATSFISKPVGNPDSASVLPPQAQPPAPKPADPTLEPAEAAPTPRTLDPTLLSAGTLATIARLAELIETTPPPPPPPPPTPPMIAHPPVGLVGGRDPNSEGNT